MDDYMVQAHNTIWDEAYRKARSEPSLNDPALTLSQRSTITMRSLADALMTFRDMMHCRYSAEAHHHNTYLPISRLPNDLLVKIFALASEMEYRFMVSGHHGPGEVTTLARLVRVCREWRRIMDNTPSLWAYLSSSYPLPANFECLARSNQAPLHISFNYRWLKYEGGRELYTKIFEEVHRWKTVKLHNVTIEALNKLENWAAPLLETLDVQWNLETTLRTINLFCGSASRLRHLTLININILWDSNLFSRLRTLHIYHYQIYSPSAQEVVQVLQSCPGLTRFRLHLPPEVHPGPIPLETPIIELLQLDYLSLRVHPLMTEHLLRRMRTPSCKYFSIDHAKATGPTFSAAMDHLNPSLSSILLAARKVDIVIKCNALDYKATAKIDKDEYDNESRMRDGDLAQYIRIQASGDRSTDELALGALSWLLDNVHAPSFSLPVSLRISDTTSLHALMDIIDRLSPAITYLYIALSSAAAKTILSYLAEPFKVVIDGTTILRWPLPNLTEVYFNRCDDLEPEAVLACMQRRAGRGLSLEGSPEHCEELPARLGILRFPCTSSIAAAMEMFPDYMEWCGLELDYEDEHLSRGWS